jgi:hypothetical protein
MLRTTCITVIGFALLPLLTACESGSYGYGYANESKRTVTVVEHTRDGVDKSTFTPQAKQLPVEGGSIADRVEVFDTRRRMIAAFTHDDYGRSHHAGVPPVLVVTQSGVTLASREFWEKMAREWEGASPSGPVSFSGGDGSSIEKAIIVNARNARDEGLGQEVYLREHFGYTWRFKGIQGGVTFTNDKIYDVVDFTTHDGKKHVLYFDSTRARANMIKRI